MERSEKKRLSKAAWTVLLLFVIVVGAIGYVWRERFGFVAPEITAQYQAVFLTNGQVYFGSISKINNNFITLKNIYYLQASDNLQGSTQTQPFSLVKLGKELHGPTDVMYINRSQVLFYEDLRPDSSVVKTIENYKP